MLEDKINYYIATSPNATSHYYQNYLSYLRLYLTITALILIQMLLFIFSPVLADELDKTKQLETMNQVAINIGQGLAQSSGSSAASDMLRNYATGTINSTADQWLKQFGHARTRMQLDSEWRIKEGAFDLLLPLYDAESTLLFTQWGIRRQDHHSIFNGGMGMRFFTPQEFYGVNTFYDRDMSGKHSRLGIGIEAGMDNLHIGANHYTRLSDWRHTQEIKNYMARPANGYDIRLNGYLPDYPLLGLGLVYEQYYGKEVALFGKEKRQQDPYAVEMQLNYTPVPLLTLAAAERIGKQNRSEALFNLTLSYRFGSSMQSQLDPGNVAMLRSVAGQRYDLVDRNNNIVLEYRKESQQEQHELKLLPQIIADEAYADGVGENILRIKIVTDKGVPVANQVVRFRADNPAAILHPPQTITNMEGMAEEHITSTQSGLFHIDALVNEQILPIEIHFNEVDYSIKDGDIRVIKDNARADGKDKNRLRVQVTDDTGQAVEHILIHFSTVNTDVTLLKQEVRTDANGIAELEAVSRKEGIAPIVVALPQKSYPAVNITFISATPPPTLYKGTWTELDKQVVANGQSKGKLVLQLQDQDDHPAANVPVSFSSTIGVLSLQQASTDANGRISLTITGTDIGKSTVNAKVDLQEVQSEIESVEIEFIADINSAQIADHGFVVLKDDAIADGSSQNEVEVTVEDAYGHRLADYPVTIAASDSVAVISNGKTDSRGTLQAQLTSSQEVNSTVTATVNGHSQQVTVHFKHAKEQQMARVETVKNRHEFSVTSGFPQTGFAGASFRLTPQTQRESGTEYSWTSSDSSVAVSDAGIVILQDKPAGSVTINARLKQNPGTLFSYTFSITHWFIYIDTLNQDLAETRCQAKHFRLPPSIIVSKGKNQRSVGALASEWGNIREYQNSYSPFIWTDIMGESVDSEDGEIIPRSIDNPASTYCIE